MVITSKQVTQLFAYEDEEAKRILRNLKKVEIKNEYKLIDNGIKEYVSVPKLDQKAFRYIQKNGKLYLCGKSMFIKGLVGIILFFIVNLISGNLLTAILSLSVVNLLMIIFYDIPNSKKLISKEFNIKNTLKIFKKTIPIFIFSFLNIYLINSSKYTLDFFAPAKIQNIFGIILMPGTILSLCSQYILNPYLMDLTNAVNYACIVSKYH